MRATAGTVMFAMSLLLAAGVARGHEHDGHAEAPETLGKIVFPTSCAASVRSEVEGGVALLHSFEYDRAAKRFQDIAHTDPDCAIAYWGSAMSLYHQIWDDPTASDLAAGWDLIQKAQQAGSKSARETAWIQALATFYQPGSVTVEQRTARYSQAMQELHASYPDDDEAGVFYALSLLAAQPPTDTDLVYPKKAVAILNEVMARAPDHPGVAHYLIHACDSPALAEQGLAAARRYAGIAPASPHALHMPAHIFTRLGLWKDDIASNLAAKAAAEQQSAGNEYRLHPMDFLEYAYLQTGQDDKARAIAADAVAGSRGGYGHGDETFYDYAQAEFPALLALETKNWKAAVELRPLADAEPGYRSLTYWAQAVGAGHRHDAAAAQAAVALLDEDRAAYRARYPDRPAPPVSSRKNEAHAWLAYAQGDIKTAFELLWAIVDYQDKVGKGEVELPAREMLADMLLDMDKPAEALQQYQLSLKADPNRFNGLYGAGLAAERLGQAGAARDYYRQLIANCDPSEGSDRVELAHARRYVDKPGKTRSL